jgi:hypothetical protein
MPLYSHRVLQWLQPRRLAVPVVWLHDGAMPSVQIKDVPPETFAVLRARAAAANQSLQEYLRSRLIAEACHPTVEEVLDRAARRRGSLSSNDAQALLREDRD